MKQFKQKTTYLQHHQQQQQQQICHSYNIQNKQTLNQDIQDQNEQDNQQQYQSDQFQEQQQSQIKQKAVFQFQYQASDLQDQQKQAFQYLLNVRNQKNIILNNQKIKKNQIKKKMQIMQSKEQQNKIIQFNDYIEQDKSNNIEQDKNNKKSQQKQQINYKQFESQTIQQIISNFDIVIANVKYLIKTHEKQYLQSSRKQNKKFFQPLKQQLKNICNLQISKANEQEKQSQQIVPKTTQYSSLPHCQPRIFSLIKLTLGEIQQLIQTLCEHNLKLIKKNYKNYTFNITNVQHKQKYRQQLQKKIKMLNLWLYSLLALHQGLSSYKHFYQVSEVNLLFMELDKIIHKQQKSQNHNIHENSMYDHDIINDEIFNNQMKKSMFINLTIIAKKFQQRHLQSCIHNIGYHIWKQID